MLAADMTDLRDYQQPYARLAAEVKKWGVEGPTDLLTTVRHVKPTMPSGKEALDEEPAGTPRLRTSGCACRRHWRVPRCQECASVKEIVK
jgi:hypothetical protein